MDAFYSFVGNRIKDARDAERLTQTELANILGISQPTVNRWEKAERVIALDDLRRLAHRLNRDLTWFLPESDSAFSPAVREIIRTLSPQERHTVGSLLRLIGSELEMAVRGESQKRAEPAGLPSRPAAEMKVGT